MWLSHFVFCCKSLKVAKKFMTLANQLRNGQNVGLGQLVLTSFYEALRLATYTMKNLLYNWINQMIN